MKLRRIYTQLISYPNKTTSLENVKQIRISFLWNDNKKYYSGKNKFSSIVAYILPSDTAVLKFPAILCWYILIFLLLSGFQEPINSQQYNFLYLPLSFPPVFLP